MSVVEKSLEYLRSPRGFKIEFAGSIGGYVGLIALNLADIEPSWLAKSPFAITVVSYVALADNIIHGEQSDPSPAKFDPRHQN